MAADIKKSELGVRVASAVVLAAMAFGAVWAGGLTFGLFAAIMGFIVFIEWMAMTPLSAFENRKIVTVAGFALALLDIIVFPGLSGFIILAIIALAIFTVLDRQNRALASQAAFAALYCGLAAVALIGLRDGGQGVAAILLLFAIVWGTDIGAYFVGRKFGGPKLAPQISPGKTQSGAIGGLVIAMVCAAIIAVLTGILNPFVAMLVAALVSVVAQTGDLFESYIKRRSGVKDSGFIIPGHGGMFDRVDGLMPASIALFIILKLI